MPHQKISFLVIDNDPDSISKTAQMIAPYKCDILTHFEQASQGYEQIRPDITLLEIAHPYSLVALKQIKKNYPEAFIVALTTSRADKDVQASIEAGAAGYILKPFLPHHLVECIEEYQLRTPPKNPTKHSQHDTATAAEQH